MFLNPHKYGWTVGIQGYKPVPHYTTWLLRNYSGSRAVIVMKQEEQRPVYLCMQNLQRHYMQELHQ